MKVVETSLFLMRRRTAELGRPVTQHVFIFDLANFSLAAATHSATIDLLRKLIAIYEGRKQPSKLIVLISAQLIACIPPPPIT